MSNIKKHIESSINKTTKEYVEIRCLTKKVPDYIKEIERKGLKVITRGVNPHILHYDIQTDIIFQ